MEEDNSQKYGVWDTKERSWVRNKEFDSLKGASRAVDRLDNQYGASRYTAKPLTPSSSGSGGMGGGAMGTGKGQDTIQHTLNPLKLSKGGKASSRADGIAQRGKTKGRTI